MKQPNGSELTKEQWDELPEEITLRYIKLGYENRAGEKAALVVVTDLLKPKSHPAEEVAEPLHGAWSAGKSRANFEISRQRCAWSTSQLKTARHGP